MSWILGTGSKSVTLPYDSGADLYHRNAWYKRVTDDLRQAPGPMKRPHVVPGVTGAVDDAPTVSPIADLNLPVIAPTMQEQLLKRPPVDPARYFTDKLLRDAPSQPSWWADFRHTLTDNPGHLLGVAIDGVWNALKYVGWNYVDFIDQLRSWDGTWSGLLTHTALLWRTVVTVLITAGLVQIGPLLMAVTEWGGLLGRLLYSTFRTLGYAADLLWQAIDALIGYISRMVTDVISVVAWDHRSRNRIGASRRG